MTPSNHFEICCFVVESFSEHFSMVFYSFSVYSTGHFIKDLVFIQKSRFNPFVTCQLNFLNTLIQRYVLNIEKHLVQPSPVQ